MRPEDWSVTAVQPQPATTTMSQDKRVLPRYRCHKEVDAVLIGDMHGGAGVVSTILVPADDSYDVIVVTRGYVTKHQPHIGGYYVRYADGYESFSPAEAFEQGYTRI